MSGVSAAAHTFMADTGSDWRALADLRRYCGESEAKSDVQDGARGKVPGGVNKHTALADVGGAHESEVGLALVAEDNAGNCVNARNGTRR